MPPPAYLWMSPGLVIFRGILPDLVEHAYASATLVLADEAKLEIPGHGHARVWMIAAGTRHSVRFAQRPGSVILMDIDTPLARSLLQAVQPEGLRSLPDAKGLLKILNGMHGGSRGTALHTAIESILGDPRAPLDPRLAQVCAGMRAHPQAWPGVAALAECAGLSEPRLQHLFKAETGVTLGQFKTALQMRHAAQVMASGSTLTVAAHAAGFADSAHFSRRFKKMFGVMPSMIFRQLQPWQIHAWN